MVQLTGIGVAFVWTFTTAFILFKVLAATVGLRVTAEEELEGLDLGEHGASAYPDFVVVGASGGMAMSSGHAPAYSPAMASEKAAEAEA